MYDMSVVLHDFYENKVRLGKAKRDELAGYRDTNLGRLKDGLDTLAAERGEKYHHPEESLNQGSYAMHTMNQHVDNEYDIDVGLIFNKEAVPADAKQARERVCDALLKKCTNFTKEPEARANAVTIWYAEGYHIDFAVYRRYTSGWGNTILEHAGASGWAARNPEDITNWFSEQIEAQSPGGMVDRFLGIEVQPKQLRRIVRFLKWFARSRSSWSLPGGMIMTTLVCEVYRPDRKRDDVALYDTMVALRKRLKGSLKVSNPVDSSQELTARAECLSQVTRLRDRLADTIEKLSILNDPTCTEVKARSAWNAVFNSDFWEEKQVAGAGDVQQRGTSSVRIECALARAEGTKPYALYASGSATLPKGVYLRFKVTETNVSPPYTVRWTILNKGDEANEANYQPQVRETNERETTFWTSTMYKGTQTMTCEILKQGRVQASVVHRMKIGAGQR